MAERGLTRRSLLAAAAGAAAGGLVRAPGASARAASGSARAASGSALARPGTAALAEIATMRLAAPVLPAGAGQPPIVAREVWALGRCTPRVAPEYGAVELAFVHHTENPNGYLPSEVPGMLRAIFAFHRYGNGWNDIGYNFVVDRFGRVFEARAGGIDEPVIGAHAGGYNYRSTGIAVLGEYGAQRISSAARATLTRLLAWKLSLHGAPIGGRVVVRVDPVGARYSRFPANTPVSLPRVAGHRDADATECPGNALYGELPSLRAATARLQGRAARLTLLAAPVSPGSPAAGGEAGALTGQLSFFDSAGGVGEPIPGVPIAIQARHVSRRGEIVQESALAQVQSGADGSFSVPFYEGVSAPGAASGAGGQWLRALCAGAKEVPAAVSEAVQVPGAVSFTPPAPPPTPEAAPPPAP